jgi:hypothetical protein
MATKVPKMPVKATTTRKAPASGKIEGAKETLAAQQPGKQTVSGKASAGPRTTTTSIVATNKAKTADATKRSKGTAAALERVSGRRAKNNKSR